MNNLCSACIYSVTGMYYAISPSPLEVRNQDEQNQSQESWAMELFMLWAGIPSPTSLPVSACISSIHHLQFLRSVTQDTHPPRSMYVPPDLGFCPASLAALLQLGSSASYICPVWGQPRHFPGWKESPGRKETMPFSRAGTQAWKPLWILKLLGTLRRAVISQLSAWTLSVMSS